MQCQANLDAMRRSIRLWSKVPLYQRKDQNPKALLETEPREEIMEKRRAHALATSHLIDNLMYENAKLFFDIPRRFELEDGQEEGEEEDEGEGVKVKSKVTVLETMAVGTISGTGGGVGNAGAALGLLAGIDADVEEGSQDEEERLITLQDRYDLLQAVSDDERSLFRAYEIYVDEQIAAELLDAVITSIVYLRMEIENRFENDAPIFEILMELQEPQVCYFPNLDPISKVGFTMYIESLMDDMYSMLGMLPRVAQDPQIESSDLETFTSK